MKQNLIPLSDKVCWQKTLQDVPHGPAHRWEYNHALYHTYKQETFLYHGQRDDFIALCPISIREKCDTKDIVTPYGFGGLISQGECPDFMHQWQHFFCKLNYVCGYFAIHPMFKTKTLDQEAINTGSNLYLLDLTLTSDELEKKFIKSASL